MLKNVQPYRFVIAGGGTGGHIFPAIAIANALGKLAPGSEFLFIGAKGKMEMEKVPQAGYAIKGLTISGFNRSSLFKNILLPFKLLKSFGEVASIFRSFKPDAVLGVGGYSTFPVLRYAQSKSIPTFIHEANSFGGKANQLLAKKATMIYTGADGMENFFPAERLCVTGNPVRQAIVQSVGKVSREEALQVFQLQPGKQTVLVVGGSLGAKSINETIAANLEAFEHNNLQLIWQTGKLFIDQAKALVANRANVFVSDFIASMEMAYAAADIVVSRSGAMAVAELCLVQKPTIFVPYPHAAEDHQTENALKLVRKNAALLVKDADASTQLMPAIVNLAGDDNKKQAIIQNIHPLGIADADERVATDMLNKLAKRS